MKASIKVIAFAFLFIHLSLFAQKRTLSDPAEVFRNPPESAKPGVLWMWRDSNLSKDGITKDLKRLGMDFGMYNGVGYESSGGTWITPEHSMKEVCWSKQTVIGNTQPLQLERPSVNPRANMPFPVFNSGTGLVEKPVIPARQTYYKDIVVLAAPANGIIAKDSIINLTDRMDADGKLDWQAPAGNWAVYRIGYTTMGTLIQPAPWKATGFECDKMSQEAIDFHMDHVIGEIQKHLGYLIGTGFSHVHFDSYEAGIPTWTPLMREEFKNRRGYDLLPYLLTFAGREIGDSTGTMKLKKEGNQLEIHITNVWANRLIGDEQEQDDCQWLPGHQGGRFLKAFPTWFMRNEPRPSKGRYCFTTWNYFTKNSALESSGLMGPVRISRCAF